MTEKIDPYKNKERYLKWRDKMHTEPIQDISEFNSDIIKRFDMYIPLQVLYIFATTSPEIDVTLEACEEFVKENEGKYKLEIKDLKLLGREARDFKITKSLLPKK